MGPPSPPRPMAPPRPARAAPAPEPRIVPDQPTAALAAPAIGPRSPRQGGFAVSPFLIMPVVALLLLACLFGVLQSGLVRVAWWANPGPSTPVPTRVAGGGTEATPTAAGVATPAPQPPTAAPEPPTEPPAAPPAATE